MNILSFDTMFTELPIKSLNKPRPKSTVRKTGLQADMRAQDPSRISSTLGAINSLIFGRR